MNKRIANIALSAAIFSLAGCASMSTPDKASENSAKKAQFAALMSSEPTAAQGYGSMADSSLIYAAKRGQSYGVTSFKNVVRIIQNNGAAAEHKLEMVATMTESQWDGQTRLPDLVTEKVIEGRQIAGGSTGPADFEISTSYGGRCNCPTLSSWYYRYTSSAYGVDSVWVLDADGFREGNSPSTNFSWNNLNKTGSYPVIGTDKWKRTIVLMHGQTAPGQDMFFRGGLDHWYAQTNMGKNCTEQNYFCAIPIFHASPYGNEWRPGDFHLDWYGKEAYQINNPEGSPLVWTTTQGGYPLEWISWVDEPASDSQLIQGFKNRVAQEAANEQDPSEKQRLEEYSNRIQNASDSEVMAEIQSRVPSVSRIGHGETALNTKGHHYWMLDVFMDCSYTAEGWFELKSYISNGPGWEGDVSQSGTPYSSANHFAQCGKVNIFRRGDSGAEIKEFPPYGTPNYL